MLIGYARTSTAEQEAGYDAQLRELHAAGVSPSYIFGEKASSVGERGELRKAIDNCGEGDVLVVTKLDRLARSVRDLLNIVDELSGKKAYLRILNMNFDTGTPTGKLMMTMLGAIAQFEREMMLERQKEGIAKAHSEGKYLGRKRKVSAQQVQELLAGGMTWAAVARELKISLPTVWRRSKEV
jgi:DNA invertase Pin-like site-specific DNA recombinase